LRRSKPDVVVAHGGDAYKYAALCSRAPIVYCAIGTLPVGARKGAQRLFWRALVRRARVVAAVSDEVAAECHHVLGVPRARLLVVPNGRDPNRYRPAPEKIASDSADVRLLFVGQLNAGKRPDRFIELVRALREVGLAVCGQIVGDGPMRDSIVGPAATAGIDMLGWCRDVVPMLQQSDLFVFPSLPDGEGMPGVLIEAGLCGLPVVATRVPGVSAVIEDGKTGSVVPVHDFDGLVRATAELVRHPERRLAMGDAARTKCEQTFAMSAVAAKWEELLRNVSAASPRRHPLKRSLSAAASAA
jgi:glycosyltransferase involved in cell wall biosynthesis